MSGMEAEAPFPCRFAALPPRASLALLAGFLLLLVAGVSSLAIGAPKGQPARAEGTADGGAPDLVLYRKIVAAVRQGEGYYPAAHRLLREGGYPIGSVFNWRLPTSAWLFAWLPNDSCVQALLLALAGGNLVWLYRSLRNAAGFAGTALLLAAEAGVVVWILPRDVCLSTELWAGQLLLLAWLCRRNGHAFAAAAAALLAACLRELALPFLLLALAFAAWKKRWPEATAWLVAVMLFCGLFAWHAARVREHINAAPLDAAPWLQLGGWAFALETIRINGLLLLLPAAASWAFLLAALLGLMGCRQEEETFLLVLNLGYLLAFAFVGTERNTYWGLATAPLLAVGLAYFPRSLSALLAGARRATPSQKLPGTQGSR